MYLGMAHECNQRISIILFFFSDRYLILDLNCNDLG